MIDTGTLLDSIYWGGVCKVKKKLVLSNSLDYHVLYVTGSGKRDIFVHIFKIELMAPKVEE